VDRTRTAETSAAAKFCASQFQRVPQNPEQGRRGCDVYLSLTAVDVQSDRCHVLKNLGDMDRHRTQQPRKREMKICLPIAMMIVSGVEPKIESEKKAQRKLN
jgi:hypothetical protein